MKMKLDIRAQKALAYLSGIPESEEEALMEVLPLSKEGEAQFRKLLSIWLEFQKAEIKEIGKTLVEVLQRLKLSSKKVKSRIEESRYLSLVRKSFRNWSAAESEQKRILIRTLLVNAATKTTSPDFVLSMFVDFLNQYSEEHFQVVNTIYQALPTGLTRKEIWQVLNPGQVLPAEDSAEADMFKMLILDLTTGYMVRQPREKDFHGYFVRAKPIRITNGSEGKTLAFDNTKKYVLTELGKQFVLYTMEEVPEEVSQSEESSEDQIEQ